jgi:hypothetical protein
VGPLVMNRNPFAFFFFFLLKGISVFKDYTDIREYWLQAAKIKRRGALTATGDGALTGRPPFLSPYFLLLRNRSAIPLLSPIRTCFWH